jgi:predicted glycoside hydrolase/deacetylase ChbG (UPF0249 family)
VVRGERVLIVNADDFGHSPGVNAGVVEAHEKGIVTSASLMVLQPGAGEAAAYARAEARLGVGLHLDLGEWIHFEGSWQPVYQRVPPEDAAAVEREVSEQLGRFRDLVGRDPTHLDSHQHVHLDGAAGAVAGRLAAKLAVPLRARTAGVSYRGDFYGQTGTGEPLPDAIAPERLLELIGSLPEGVTELACHPGRGVDSDPYGREREVEVEALCDPRVRAAIERGGIRLSSFAEVRV